MPPEGILEAANVTFVILKFLVAPLNFLNEINLNNIFYFNQFIISHVIIYKLSMRCIIVSTLVLLKS